MNRICKLALLISLIIFNGDLFSQNQWTLEKCIEHAKSNNLQIKKQELAVEQSKNNILESQLSFIPSVNASLNHNMNWGRSVNLQDLQIIHNKLSQSSSANIGASITLFEGLKKINQLKSNKVSYQIALKNIEKLKNDISINIAKSYLETLLAYELEQVAEQNFKSINEQVERVKKLVNAGKEANTKLLEMQAQLASERFQYISAQNNVRTNLLTLAQLLDLESLADFDITKPKIDALFDVVSQENITDIFNSATNLPQIKSAELELKNSELQYKIQKGLALPQLSFSAGYGTYYSDNQTEKFFNQFNNNRNPSIGFGLSIPIFNNWRNNTAIKNARLAIKSAQIDLKQTNQALYKEIQQAYYDAIAAYEKYKASEQNLVSMEEVYKFTEQKFDLGMLNSTDYTVARTNLFKSQSEFYQSKFQYLFQLKILDFYKGIPITL
jgi:Outer membrane protein